MYNQYMKIETLMKSWKTLLAELQKAADKNDVQTRSIFILLKIDFFKAKTQKELIDSVQQEKLIRKQKDLNSLKVKITNAVNELEEKGLLVRTKDDNDKRIKIIQFTKKGDALIKKIKEDDYV